MKQFNDQRYMKLALKEAGKALTKNEVPVGAIIIKDHKIIAKAHNQRETKANALCHAEILAIDKACKKLGNFRLDECTMYVTLEPCCMCAGAIVQSRIEKVVFGAKDDKYGAVGSVVNIFEVKSNHKVVYEQGVMESECRKIIKDFFRDLRIKKTNN